ncbi:MAG: hypothetical protein FH749_10170 [Firmicutes bacterium]|nr:hypothetical protein [Bacillota bacterium]
MALELLVGCAASGKTEYLLERYKHLADSEQTDRILVLLWNARDVKYWRENLDLAQAGLLNIYTYFGWVQRELRRHWLNRGFTANWLEPEFLTVETSQYLMLEQLQAEAAVFDELTTSPERLAIQLGSCHVLASLNSIEFDHIGERLQQANPGTDPAIYRSVQNIINRHRDQLLDNGAMDYGLAVAAYQRLLADLNYVHELRRQFSHLLADDVGEQAPAAHDLIEALLPGLQSALLAFASDGGHAGFFGADPRGAWNRFSKQGTVRLIRPQGQQWLAASAHLGARLIRPETPLRNFAGTGPDLEVIHEDLRSQVLTSVGQRITRLVVAGTPPGEIAVIAPLADKVMEHSLARTLGEANIPLQVLAKNRRLIDQPFVRAMMTISLLAHPQWKLEWGVPDLVQSLEILLKTDPVRAWLLARQFRDDGLQPLDYWLRERAGFRVSEGYDLLQEWLAAYKAGPVQPIDVFLQRVFGELLSRLPPTEDDLVVVRQLIVSAQKFASTSRRFPHLAENPGAAFMHMLSAGTVAAESLLTADTDAAVILTTPYAYLSGHLTSSVQVWLDCTSERWFHNDSREILNPHVLSGNWQLDRQWSDEDDVRNRLENGARTVRALLRRCRERLLATYANVDSQGFEQEGQLLEAIYQTLGRRSS